MQNKYQIKGVCFVQYISYMLHQYQYLYHRYLNILEVNLESEKDFGKDLDCSSEQAYKKHTKYLKAKPNQRQMGKKD